MNAKQQNILDWEFPLPRTHTGILMGNATTGIMVWGEDDTLKITLGRADLWDHRGGMPWTEKQNYADIRKNLEGGNEAGLRALFVTDTDKKVGQPGRPSVIPVGRIELNLGSGARLTGGTLNVKNGEVRVEYSTDTQTESLTLALSMDANILAIESTAQDSIRIKALPAYDTLNGALEAISFPEPRRLDNTGGPCGWVQALPVDPGVAVLYSRTGNTLWLVNARGETEDTAVQAGYDLLETAQRNGVSSLKKSCLEWWTAYWQDVPVITLPNPALQNLYNYGMYKFAGFSQPTGIAGTLQGPWIEEYQMPPWSSDYHFNINVQMCYWPAFKGNRLDHLKPLFDLIFSWESTLRANAKAFIGIDDGIMLPHAVDDHCTCMGGFWTGCIDHGCTAWVAQMMYDYAIYSGDISFLREKAFPFMKGTMRVYEEMMEQEGDTFSLPVSVSPEYRGASMDAWGKDASFQLACVHRLVENLETAASRLALTPNPIWAAIAGGLPKASLVKNKEGRDCIALWESTPLEESHRHHSHLAGICPFDTIPFDEAEWLPPVSNSVNQWIGEGMGLWSGWCVPWASMLHSRFGNGEMAEMLLTIWESVFTNEGRGTLHDCNYPGFSLMGATTLANQNTRPEVMQLDAGFGAVVAIQDMLMHTRRGVHYFFSGVPAKWKTCAFTDMLTEGAFLVSGSRAGGKTEQITLKAQVDGAITFATPWAGGAGIQSSHHPKTKNEAPVITLTLTAGEEVTLTP